MRWNRIRQNMNAKVLKLDSRDNVLIALEDLVPEERVLFGSQTYTVATRIPAKHKFATQDLPAGADVVMYGVLVGKAMQSIRQGELLTIRNVHHEAAGFHEKTEEFGWTPPDVSRWKDRAFQGYARSDGQVGTRNYWLVVPLVFCENRNIALLKQSFEEELGFAAPQIYRRQVAALAKLYRAGKTDELKSSLLPGNDAGPQRSRLFENIDGVKFLLHEGGCGGTREDSNNLCGLI